MPAETSISHQIHLQRKKLFYLDNIKVLLTVLVILHHTFITYGAPGGWYYAQKSTQLGALIPMTMFVAVNQSFFMGFFFLLSAYFIPSSYDRKGGVKFVSDRLMRLGIPLLFYSLIFSPLLTYFIYYFGYGHHISLLRYLSGFDDWIDFGVLWFVAALLLFTMVYVFSRKTLPGYRWQLLAAPSAGMISLFAVVIGMISFFVRIVFPVGWVLKPLGFQQGHFSQYIAFFSLGLMAAKNDWLNQLTFKSGKQMAWLAMLLLLFFPVFFVIKEKFNIPLDWYSGGLHWPSLLYAVWEQLIGFSIITAILVFGKKYWDKTSALLKQLSRYTFAVYIFHPLLLVSIALALRNWAIEPAFKLLIAAPFAVIGSFLLASIIVLIPGVKKII